MCSINSTPCKWHNLVLTVGPSVLSCPGLAVVAIFVPSTAVPVGHQLSLLLIQGNLA
jgi:hypothetical protein